MTSDIQGPQTVDIAQAATFRLEHDGLHVGTAFAFDTGIVVGSSHCLPRDARTVTLVHPPTDRIIIGTVLGNVREPDVFVASAPEVTAGLTVKPSIHLGEDLYTWGYPATLPDGDSLTLSFEGPCAGPYRLKLKQGHVTSGFSGSPLFSREGGELIGMVASTRDMASDLGGRAIPASTISDIVKSTLDPNVRLRSVSKADLDTVLSMLATAYRITQPTLAFDHEIASSDHNLDGRLAADLLRLASHDDGRQAAAHRWLGARPDAFRFIVREDEGSRYRVGATCVLPLTNIAFRSYCSGDLAEFELDESCLVRTGRSRNICVQSYGFVGTLKDDHTQLLRSALVEHVREMAVQTGPIEVVAEAGTHAGFREATFFGMEYLCLSYNRRPLMTKTFESFSEVDELLASQSESIS